MFFSFSFSFRFSNFNFCKCWVPAHTKTHSYTGVQFRFITFDFGQPTHATHSSPIDLIHLFAFEPPTDFMWIQCLLGSCLCQKVLIQFWLALPFYHIKNSTPVLPIAKSLPSGLRVISQKQKCLTYDLCSVQKALTALIESKKKC